MFNVEQFVYTTAEIEKRKGYQIVAKSDGIINKTINELESYVYPIDIDPNEFQESRSLIFLNDGHVVYSRIKNVGVGYDGRENTIYNHSFVFSKEDFKKYDYDSRIFDKFYLEDKTVRDSLPTLSINPPKIALPLTIDSINGILEEILEALFTNKKIALLISDVDVELPQKILSLVPRSLRVVSFSTFVVEPKKQSIYRLILNAKLNTSKIDNSFKIILPKKISAFSPKTDFDKSLAYYAQLIKSRNYAKINEMQELFEELSGKEQKNKLILLCNYFQYLETTDKEKRTQYAEKILEMLKQFNYSTFSYYFEKIKDSLNPYKKLEKNLQTQVNPYKCFINALFFLPKIADVYTSFIDQQSHDKDKKDSS